jgi:Adenylate and Guanylate cyclase catalytic domain/zinc-ribbon domain
VDRGGDSSGGLTTAGLVCGSCGTELPPNSKFCNECGAPVTQVSRSAEYKQVTVLFADVVHSMDIAAAVGAERLREIMADLADRCAAVVQRYGGTVDKFTGDGIMAVFGAPVAMEDHAVRACLAGLGVQEETKRLAVEVRERDGVDLQLRVGLNSGEVIAGAIGSGPFGYPAVLRARHRPNSASCTRAARAQNMTGPHRGHCRWGCLTVTIPSLSGHPAQNGRKLSTHQRFPRNARWATSTNGNHPLKLDDRL